MVLEGTPCTIKLQKNFTSPLLKNKLAGCKNLGYFLKGTPCAFISAAKVRTYFILSIHFVSFNKTLTNGIYLENHLKCQFVKECVFIYVCHFIGRPVNCPTSPK